MLPQGAGDGPQHADSPEGELADDGANGDPNGGAPEGEPPIVSGPRLEATEAAALARLQEVDPDTLSPREAMDLIYELRGLLRGQHEWMEE
jgi:DNA mismatch repair protein MutS